MAHILVLDDELDAVVLLKRLFEGKGHKVFGFTDEEEAIGHARANSQVQYLAHFLRLGLGERAADDGKVLGGDGNLAAVHAAQADHHGVAGAALVVQAKVAVAVGQEGVDLLEAAGVEEIGDALAGGALALGMLAGDGRLAAPLPLLLAAAAQFVVQFLWIHALLLEPANSLLQVGR